MAHHAYLVAGESEKARKAARAFIARELGLPEGSPDVMERAYGLFSVEDARALLTLAYQAPLAGDTKALVVSAGRIYHEAQNALLKLFEEPPADTALFLVVPLEGALLGTLRSRLMPLPGWQVDASSMSEDAVEFVAGDAKGRSALIARLASAKDDDAKRAARDVALSILDGVERIARAAWKKDETKGEFLKLLNDSARLRPLILDRSSSLKMILEHLSIVLPVGLGRER